MAHTDRQCVGCGNVKPLSDYYEYRRGPGGRHRYCKLCCKVNNALGAVRKRDRKSKISFRQQYRAIQEGIRRDPDITLAKLFKRDQGICGECKRWVNPGAASIDHRIAIINGGTHTWDNIQLTHLICNLRKGRT